MILSLSTVEFMDSAIFDVLVGAKRDADAKMKMLVIVQPLGAAQQIFKLTNADQIFDLCEPIDQVPGTVISRSVRLLWPSPKKCNRYLRNVSGRYWFRKDGGPLTERKSVGRVPQKCQKRGYFCQPPRPQTLLSPIASLSESTGSQKDLASAKSTATSPVTSATRGSTCSGQ